MFWVSVVLVAAGLAIREIPNTYQSLYEHPSTVEVLSTSMAMHSFPFPTVVVCPKAKIRKSVAMEYITRYGLGDRVHYLLFWLLCCCYC